MITRRMKIAPKFARKVKIREHALKMFGYLEKELKSKTFDPVFLDEFFDMLQPLYDLREIYREEK